jgi:hypothetical protein
VASTATVTLTVAVNAGVLVGVRVGRAVAGETPECAAVAVNVGSGASTGVVALGVAVGRAGALRPCGATRLEISHTSRINKMTGTATMMVNGRYAASG